MTRQLKWRYNVIFRRLRPRGRYKDLYVPFLTFSSDRKMSSHWEVSAREIFFLRNYWSFVNNCVSISFWYTNLKRISWIHAANVAFYYSFILFHQRRIAGAPLVGYRGLGLTPPPTPVAYLSLGRPRRQTGPTLAAAAAPSGAISPVCPTGRHWRDCSRHWQVRDESSVVHRRWVKT